MLIIILRSLHLAEQKKKNSGKKSGKQPLQDYYEYLLNSIAINFNNNFVKIKKKCLKQPKLCMIYSRKIPIILLIIRTFSTEMKSFFKLIIHFSSDICVDGGYIHQRVCMCVYVAWIRIFLCFFFFFIFINIRTQRCGKKNKEDEEKAKCVTKDRTAATQSFGLGFGASSDSIYIHSAEC